MDAGGRFRSHPHGVPAQFYATADQFARWRLKLPQFNGGGLVRVKLLPTQVAGACVLDLEQQVLFVLGASIFVHRNCA